MELFKEMPTEELEELLATLNRWWRDENMPADILKARVVLIFKKGDTSKFENYRPMSSVNAAYSFCCSNSKS